MNPKCLLICVLLAGCSHAVPTIKTPPIPISASPRHRPVSRLNAPQSPVIALEWQFNNPIGSGVTELWATTNLVDWRHYADIPGTNQTLRATVPTNNALMFFKIRNRDTNGVVSDWCRRTN